MSRENKRSNIKKVTAAAAALLLAASLSLPSGTEIMGVSFGNAVVASAAEIDSGTCGTDLTWSLDDTGTLTITGTGKMNNWNSRSTAPWYGNRSSIKSVVISNGVTAIGNYAFYECSNLTSITIPSSVTSIRYYAFGSCASLTSITIPNSVNSIGESTFSGCTSLTSITIPDRVTSIGISAFSGCTSLTSITIPNSVTSIGDFAFGNCTSLTSITISDGVNSIGYGAFYNCTSLESIFLSDSLFDIAEDAIPSSAAQIKYTVYGDNVTIKGTTLGSDLTSLTIPDTIGGKAVTSIGNSAFSDCTSLESIFIPDSVTSIETDAIPTSAAQVRYTFDTDGNAIVTGVIPNGQSSVTFPTEIGGKSVKAVYINDEITGVNVPESVTKVSYSVDANGNITIKKATLGSGQTSVAIPEKIDGKAVTAIGDYAFGGCSSLTSITIPNSVVSIKNYAFNNCTSLASVYFGDNSQLTSIGDYAFCRCSNLKSIKFPESVQSIGIMAFGSCGSLESVTIPKNVSSIGLEAFASCSSINVDENNLNYSSKNGVLFDKNKTKLIRYPANKSGTSYVIPDSVKLIDKYAFAACGALTSVTIPEGVTSIGDLAFSHCLSLKSITIPNSVNSIGNYAFTDDSDYGYYIESIFLPKSLTSIGTDAIKGFTTKVRYTVDDEGNAAIVNIELGTEQTKVDIPEMIGEYPVIAAAEEYQKYVGEHTHLGGSATCIEKPVCSICGQGYDEPLGHSFTKYVSDNNATCTENGTETAKCDRCDKTDTREEADSALGHDHSGDWQKNDTADHWKVCTRDGCTEILDKANHDFDKGVVTTEPTEDAEGVRTYTCETCGYKKTESIAKLNHTHKSAEDYSKDETGHWHACSGCDEKVGFESHDFDEGVVTTEPTEETEGVKTFTCKDCGYTKTETIPVTEPSIPETPEEKVNSFVERLYENVLGRPSDPSKETHIDNLNEGKTATKVAYDFVFSPEFTELDISNEERVTIMYNTFLDRDPDPAGLETWTKALDNGCSIGHIFYGFTQSGEFGEICDAYGIEQGTWEYVENRDKSAELTSFVSRLYTKALGRKFDVNGLNDHTGTYLENHDLYQMAYNFIFSPEFLSKELSDEDFVDTMYRTFFDREADPDGRADWLDRMANQGYSREDVLAGFVGSQECVNLVARFGI